MLHSFPLLLIKSLEHGRMTAQAGLLRPRRKGSLQIPMVMTIIINSFIQAWDINDATKKLNTWPLPSRCSQPGVGQPAHLSDE